MNDTTHHCGWPLGRIHGRTLTTTLRRRKRTSRFEKVRDGEWVTVCPNCDANVLSQKDAAKLPFRLADGGIYTVMDINRNTRTLQCERLHLCRLVFSSSALEAGIALAAEEDSTTSDVEQRGRELRTRLSTRTVLAFSRAVCNWGRGERVWANLIRHNQGQLGGALFEWLRAVPQTNDVEKAIAPGLEIPGLGVSFASKHLRMLEPARFPVLDSVLSAGLGFALNSSGYWLFCRDLGAFKEANQLTQDIASIEAGLFQLVRQVVRAN